MKFEDIVDTGGLGADDEARLRHVHDLLMQAGPPPDLSPGLDEAPSLRPAADPPEVAFLFRRRRGLATVLALAAALAAFGGGYAFGHSKSKTQAFSISRVVPMHGRAAGQLAVLKIGKADSVGNWPMELTVTGLHTQGARGAYYELWLTHDGKPTVPCGSFRVTSKTTTVRMSVPYSFRGADGWVVTSQPPHDHGPGSVVLTT